MRAALGLSQQELADALGVSRETISLAERKGEGGRKVLALAAECLVHRSRAAYRCRPLRGQDAADG